MDAWKDRARRFQEMAAEAHARAARAPIEGQRLMLTKLAKEYEVLAQEAIREDAELRAAEE